MKEEHFVGTLSKTTKPRLNLIDIQCGTQSICVLMDTGAPTSRINKHTAKTLNLPIEQDGDYDYAVIPKITIGPFQWENLRVSINPHEDKSSIYHGRQTDGIFGCDVMNGLCWIFEPTMRKFHVCTPNHSFFSKWTEGAGCTSIHPHKLADLPSNVWATECFLNGQGPIHTDLDTGAQRTILTSKAGAFLDPTAAREEIRLSNGGTERNVGSYRTTAEEITIAGVRFLKPVVAVCDPIFSVAPELLSKPAILLGIDVIGESRYAFDLHHGEFWIHP